MDDAAAVVARRRQRRRRITRKRDQEEEKTGGKLQVSLRTSGRRGQEKEITCSEVTGDVHVRTKGQREEKMHEQDCVRIDARVLLLVEDEKDVTHCPHLASSLIGLTCDEAGKEACDRRISLLTLRKPISE